MRLNFFLINRFSSKQDKKKLVISDKPNKDRMGGPKGTGITRITRGIGRNENDQVFK